VELVAFRGISDGDAELAEVFDWTEHLHVIDRNLARACEALKHHLSGEGMGSTG
jgi:adenosylhomocysteine nucleosidase